MGTCHEHTLCILSSGSTCRLSGIPIKQFPFLEDKPSSGMHMLTQYYRPGAADTTTGGTTPSSTSFGVRGILHVPGYLALGTALLAVFPWLLT
jgi:hypothetical protein